MTFPRYSQAESPEFRDRMDRWMAVIASLFRDRLGANYVSTILMGGYGRGWGAVSVTPDGPMPVNDLDIAVVTRERLSPDDLYRLHEEATKLVNPASRYSMLDASAMDVHADVMNFIETDFASLAPTQFHLDLVHASRVVDGVDVLKSAGQIGVSSLDMGDALRLVFNHAINLFEPCAVGPLTDEANRQALFFTATKAAVASGSAVIMVHGRYSPIPPERFEAFRALAAEGALDGLLREAPDFGDVFERFARDRSEVTGAKLAAAGQTYATSRRIILEAARYVLARLFGGPRIEDPLEIARAVPSLWTTEFLKRQPLTPKGLAKRALQIAGLRKAPPSWRPRALVFGAGVALLNALTLDAADAPVVDAESLEAGRGMLRDAGVNVAGEALGMDGWMESGAAAVSALKRQSWIR